MKMMMIKGMMFMSCIIPTLKTPMSMGILLLTQTTLSTIFMSLNMLKSWMTMILFLMLIGGLLILFMYMSSIASNEKFIPNIKMLVFLMLILTIPMEENIIEFNKQENYTYIMKETTSMSKMYNKKYMMLTMLMFIYLLITMIVISKIIKIYKGPLRSTK